MANLSVEQGTVGKLILPSNPTGSSLSLHKLTVVSAYVTTPVVSKQAIMNMDF
jgi:hypothetical protein